MRAQLCAAAPYGLGRAPEGRGGGGTLSEQKAAGTYDKFAQTAPPKKKSGMYEEASERERAAGRKL